jgi:hypothetical protein
MWGSDVGAFRYVGFGLGLDTGDMLGLDTRVQTRICWGWIPGFRLGYVGVGYQDLDSDMLGLDTRVWTRICWGWIPGFGLRYVGVGYQGLDLDMLGLHSDVSFASVSVSGWFISPMQC